MKIFNSKVKLVFFSLLLITLANQADAYRVVRYRDHWGIFGGYGMVESRSIYENAELVEVHIDCRSLGEMDCNAIAANNNEELMFPLDNIRCSDIDAFFEKVDNMVNSGTTTYGNLIESYAIQQVDGSIKNFQFNASWATDNDGGCQIQLEITQLTY